MRRVNTEGRVQKTTGRRKGGEGVMERRLRRTKGRRRRKEKKRK